MKGGARGNGGVVMTLTKLFKIFTSFSLVLNLIFFSLAQAQTAQQIALKTFPSTVLLVMEDAYGQPISLASGFFVREGIIATNLHAIEKASRGYAKIVREKAKYDIAGLVGIDEKRDLVLLSIPVSKAPPLIIGDSHKVAIGDEIYVIGNPLGLEGTFSKGIISGIRKIDSDIIFQITAPISPGSSGGPVLDSQGKVIGVAVATFVGGQNLNFSIPSSYLESMLKDVKSIKPLSVKGEAKQDKSILADLGGRSTESATGGSLTWDYTSHLVCYYSFSIRNQSRWPIKNIYCLIIFYDRNDDPIEFKEVRYEGVIPPGLAKRMKGEVHKSVKDLTTKYGHSTPSTKVEFRVLDFQIVD